MMPDSFSSGFSDNTLAIDRPGDVRAACGTRYTLSQYTCPLSVKQRR
jgi:hypothetical protein